MAYMERRTRRCANHIIAAKEDENTYLNHVSALGHVQPKIDNGPPPRMPHLRRNRKREAIQDERNFEIERENIILLNRMQDILRKPTDKKRSTTPFSMNIAVRRRELARITQENKAMLDRIQKARPAYSDKALREHSKKHDKLAKQVSEFATGRRGLGVETGRPATAVLSPIKERPGSGKKQRPRSKSRNRQKRPQTAKPYHKQEGPNRRRPVSAAVPRSKDSTDSKISELEERSPYITDNRAFGRRPPEREGKRHRPFSAPTDFDEHHYQASKRAEEQDAGVVEDDSAESNDFERQVLLAQSGYTRPHTRGLEGSYGSERRYQRPVSAGSRRREHESEDQKGGENAQEPFISSAADGWKSEDEKKAFEEEFAREFSTSESKQPSRRNEERQQSHGVREDSNGSMKSEGGVSVGNDSFDQLSRFGAAPSAATEGSSGARPTSARRRGRPTSATGSRSGNEEGNAIQGETSTRNEYVPPRTRSGERLRSSDEEETAESDHVAAMYSADVNDTSKEDEEFVNWNEASIDKIDRADAEDDVSNMELSVTGNIAASGSREAEATSPSNRTSNGYNESPTNGGEAFAEEQQSSRNNGADSAQSDGPEIAQSEAVNRSNERSDCSTQDYDMLMSKMDSPSHVSGEPNQSRWDDSHVNTTEGAEVSSGDRANEDYGLRGTGGLHAEQRETEPNEDYEGIRENEQPPSTVEGHVSKGNTDIEADQSPGADKDTSAGNEEDSQLSHWQENNAETDASPEETVEASPSPSAPTDEDEGTNKAIEEQSREEKTSVDESKQEHTPEEAKAEVSQTEQENSSPSEEESQLLHSQQHNTETDASPEDAVEASTTPSPPMDKDEGISKAIEEQTPKEHTSVDESNREHTAEQEAEVAQSEQDNGSPSHDLEKGEHTAEQGEAEVAQTEQDNSSPSHDLEEENQEKGEPPIEIADTSPTSEDKTGNEEVESDDDIHTHERNDDNEELDDAAIDRLPEDKVRDAVENTAESHADSSVGQQDQETGHEDHSGGSEKQMPVSEEGLTETLENQDEPQRANISDEGAFQDVDHQGESQQEQVSDEEKHELHPAQLSGDVQEATDKEDQQQE